MTPEEEIARLAAELARVTRERDTERASIVAFMRQQKMLLESPMQMLLGGIISMAAQSRGLATKPLSLDTGLDDLTRLRDALSAYIEEHTCKHVADFGICCEGEVDHEGEHTASPASVLAATATPRVDDAIIHAEAVRSPDGYVQVTIRLRPPERPASAYVRRDTALALAATIIRATGASGIELAEALFAADNVRESPR